MKNISLKILLAVVTVGCSLEERPYQAAVENTLPVDGPTIEYDPESSFTNIDQIASTLSSLDAEKFNTSLGWYGTESSFDLARLEGKTASEVVNIVNCLKMSEEEQRPACFDK